MKGARPGERKPAGRAAPVPRDVVQVNGYSDRWLGQGFPWVYPAELVSVGASLDGEEVTVVGPGGAVRGRGLTDPGWIAVRVFRHDAGPLDRAWMDGVVERAALRRRGVIGAATSAWRLIHGENDGLPGLRVDWWHGWVVVIADSPSVGRLVPLLVESLCARLPVEGVYLCHRADPRETSGREGRSRWVLGEAPAHDVVIEESGMRMGVRPGEGPDVGSYMDMREVRRWLAPTWRGRRVLNTFAYTGAFSVAAALGGAEEVVSVDLSRPYLQRAKENMALNGLDPERFAYEAEDSFKFLDRARRTGRAFDVVVLDPPSFSHGPEGTWSAQKDLARLVAAASRVLAPGGWLVVASNLGQVAPRAFRGQVADGLRKAGREAVEVAWFGAAPDFPCAVSFPEAHYLKVGVWVLG